MTGNFEVEQGAPRVALLTNAPAPYRTEFFNELARRCNLLVVFDTRREPDREWVIEESDFAFDWRVSRGLEISAAASASSQVRPTGAPCPLEYRSDSRAFPA